ncbi:MAG: hypothetical protein ABSA17_05375, partial [Rhabdochlamydiaceae bacterium]
ALANPVSRAALFSLIGASYSLTFLTAQLLIMGLYFAVTTGSQLAGPAASMLMGGAQMAVGGAQGVASIFSRGAKGAAPAVNAEVEQMIQELTTPVRNQQAVDNTVDQFVAGLPAEEAQLFEQIFDEFDQMQTQGQPVVTMTPAELKEVLDSQGPVGTEAFGHDELNQLMEDLVKDEASNRFNIDEFISEYFEDEASIQSGVVLPKVNMTSEQLNEVFEEGPTVNKQVVMSAAQLDAVWSEVNIGEQALDAAWDTSVQPVAAKSTGSSLNPAKVVKVGLGLYAGFKLAKIAFDLLRKDAENIAEEGEKMVQEAEAKYGSTDEVDSVATYQEQQTYSFV